MKKFHAIANRPVTVDFVSREGGYSMGECEMPKGGILSFTEVEYISDTRAVGKNARLDVELDLTVFDTIKEVEDV